MKPIVAIVGALLVSTVLLTGAEAPRFVQKLRLTSGQTIVVAEGDLEPRSMGSYGVRLYSGVNPQFPTDDFVCGVIRARNGFIERSVLADVDGDGRKEMVVVVRCAGTGNYLSADAFAIDKKRLMLRASVSDLAPHADVVAALKKTSLKIP